MNEYLFTDSEKQIVRQYVRQIDDFTAQLRGIMTMLATTHGVPNARLNEDLTGLVEAPPQQSQPPAAVANAA